MAQKLKIMQLSNQELIESIQSGNIAVCIIGIGRIGLPTALSFANSGLPTVGVDINYNLVEMINSKIFPLKDEPGYDVIFEKVIHKKFHVSTKIEEIVPTLKKAMEVDGPSLIEFKMSLELNTSTTTISQLQLKK